MYREKFSKEHLLKCQKGIELYNGGFLWECHEELEDPWVEDAHSAVRYVYWAIIQVATAVFHYENANLAGAQGMLNKAKDKFQFLEANDIESDLLYKFLAWKKFKKLVFEIPASPCLEDFKNLSNFKFSRPDKWQQHLLDDKE